MSKPQISDAVLAFLEAYQAGKIKNIHVKFDADFVNPVIEQQQKEIERLKAELKITLEIGVEMQREVERLKGIEKDHLDDWKRIKDAEKKCEQLKQSYSDLKKQLSVDYQYEEIEQLKKQNAILRSACEFYGDKENWNISQPHSNFNLTINSNDKYRENQDWGGKRARQALKECEL